MNIQNMRERLLASTMIGGLAVAAMGVAVTPAAAQQPEAVEVETVVITGSRIRQPGFEAASPISSVGAEEISLRQPVAVEALIKDLPSAVPAIGSATNNGSGGGATVNLRGLGSNRTLVLVNGRRMVPFNLAGVVDTNTIPVALIERVDLVTGGASAVYGADAVAGVVNFVLRENFEGVELSGSYGIAEEGDAVRRRIDLTVGGNFADGRGNAVASVGWTETDALYQDQRPLGLVARSSTSGAPQGSGTTTPGRFGTLGANGGTSIPTTWEINPATGALISPTSPGYNTAAYNYNPWNLYQTPLDRYQLTGMANYRITPSAEAYLHATYVRSDVSLDNAPSGTFGNTYNVPIGNPLIPDAMRQQLCAARGIAAGDCVSGAAGTTNVPLTINRRFTEWGGRPVLHENRTLWFVAGVRGDIGENWEYDVYLSHGESDQTRARLNWGSASKLRQALNTVSATECLAPGATAAIAGCVPINVFGADGSITDAMLNWIDLSAYDMTSVEQDVVSASISGLLPEAFRSPFANTGIALAAGLEYRESYAQTRADSSLQINGEVLGTGAPVPDRQGSFELREGYIELAVPLVEDRPFVHSLGLEAAYRHSEFSTGGNSIDYGSWKVGLDWAPIQEFRFRTMLQRATRAPNIGELFAPQVTGLGTLATDPCQGTSINSGQAGSAGTLSNLCVLTGVPTAAVGSVAAPNSGQANVLTGGNPNLGPEEADTFTFGFVWRPTFTNNFNLTVDYYDVKMESTVDAPSINDVINGCYSTTLNPGLTFNEFCALIGRNTANGSLNGVEAAGVGLVSSNIGTARISGVDFSANYRVPLDTWDMIGSLDLSVMGNVATRHESQATPASINRDCLGYYSSSCGQPKVKTRVTSRATWSTDPYSVSLQWRHLSGVEVEPGSGNWFADYTEIDAFNYFDLTGTWDVTDNVRAVLTVNNLFNEKPPEVGSTIGTTADNNGNTFPQTYDVLGRYYTFGLTMRF